MSRYITEFFQGNTLTENELEKAVELYSNNYEFQRRVDAFIQDEELTKAQRVSLYANVLMSELLPSDQLPSSLTNEFNKPYKELFDLYAVDFFPPTADEEQRSLYKKLLLDYRCYYLDFGILEISNESPFFALKVKTEAPSMKVYMKEKNTRRNRRDHLESKWHDNQLSPKEYAEYAEMVGFTVEELKETARECDAEHREFINKHSTEEERQLRRMRVQADLERELARIKMLEEQKDFD